MEQNVFFANLGSTISKTDIATKNGLSYLAAATAMRLAGRPQVEFVDFNGSPYLAMLNGAVVAIDLPIEGTDVMQRTWLHVMDRDNGPMKMTDIKLTDINNSRTRCLVKAIASVFGVGMSVFLGCDGDGPKAVKALGVNPESDLAEVQAIVSVLKSGGQPYVEWTHALAAARAVDPSFHWNIVEWNGMPYREILGGLMVDVDTVFKGKQQRISLPVMDAAFNQLSVDKATVADWNKTVMRALTKSIAFSSGYGLKVYSEDFGMTDGANEANASSKDEPKANAKATPAEAKASKTTAAESKPQATPEASTSKPDAKTEVKADAKPEVKPEVKTQTQPEVKADAQVETTPEVKSEAKPDEAAAPEAQKDGDPKADAPAAAPASTTSPAAASASPTALQRFQGVFKDRKEKFGVKGVLDLFAALKLSTKFEDQDKPECFAYLVTAATTVVDAENIQQLVTAVREYGAMQHLNADTRELTAARLTSTLLNAAVAAGDEAAKVAPEDLVSAGIAQNVEDVLRLAAIDNVSKETLDLIRDLLEMTPA